jgi:hypothetical protein
MGNMRTSAGKTLNEIILLEDGSRNVYRHLPDYTKSHRRRSLNEIYRSPYVSAGLFLMDVKEMRWEDMDWSHLAQDGVQWWALVNTLMKFRVT